MRNKIDFGWMIFDKNHPFYFDNFRNWIYQLNSNDLLYNIDKDDIYYIHIIDKNDKVFNNVSIKLNNLELDKTFNLNTIFDIKNDKIFSRISKRLLSHSEFDKIINSELDKIINLEPDKIINLYNILLIEYEKLIEINAYYENNFKLYLDKNLVEDINSLDLEDQLIKGKTELTKMLLDLYVYKKN